MTTFYGDDDGFGVGATSGALPGATTGAATADDAPLTDVPLISRNQGVFFGTPAFEPTGGFAPFTLTGDIVAATLTVRFAGLENSDPIEGRSLIQLDGLFARPLFGPDIFDLTAPKADSNDKTIEDVSFALSASFFPLLADGSVSLAGTLISQTSGFGVFQIDFLKLTIETHHPVATIPLPAPALLLASGLAALGGLTRRRRQAGARR